MVPGENISGMVDQFLGWMVIFAPFALSAVFILIPAKAENRRLHMKWRWALFFCGIIFSGIAWWQQARAAKSAQDSTSAAISATSDAVATNVKAQDKIIIDEQTAKIDQLQKAVNEEGATVHRIEGSDFVTGHRPIRVEVANSQTSNGPVHAGQLTLTQKGDTSTRADAPVKTIVTIQSDVDFPTLKIELFCDATLVEGHALTQNNAYMSYSEGIDQKTHKIFWFHYDYAQPLFGPGNPLEISLWSKDQVRCEKVATF